MRLSLKSHAVWLAALLALAGCGGSGSGDFFPDDVPIPVNPVVARVDPVSGPAGTTITIYGMGFSTTYPNNVVVIGDSSTSATGYSLVVPPGPDEIEAITAEVPAGAALGANSVFVIVYDNVSNTDVTFTVTP